MSYERGVLGASPLSWTQRLTLRSLFVPAGMQAMCVTSSPSDLAWANARAGSTTRCTQQRNLLGMPISCTTESDNPGSVYNCHQFTAEQETLFRAGMDPFAATPTTGTGVAAAVVCAQQRSDRRDMANAQRRAVWDVQDSLCRLGVLATDPGPVNGMITNALQTAIRRFQGDHGLDATGRLDASTLSSLGFSWFEVQQISTALKGTAIGPEATVLDVVIPIVVIGGIGIGGFFAYKRFIRRS